MVPLVGDQAVASTSAYLHIHASAYSHIRTSFHRHKHRPAHTGISFRLINAFVEQ